MNRNFTIRFSVLFWLLILPLVSVGAQVLGPSDIDPNTEDTRCVEKNYRHKTARELNRMTPEELIDEDTRHWNYHVSLMDKYGMFTLNSYQEGKRIGVAIIPILTKLAMEFGSRPRSKCQEARFFTAFAIAADVDDQIVRLRTRKDGQAAISATADAIQRMEDTGLAAVHPNKYPFGLYVLDLVRGINDHDGLMRELLKVEFGLQLSDEEFANFVKFLTSTYPTYPSWTPRVNMSRDLRPNKKKYHDAYLQFKKNVETDPIREYRQANENRLLSEFVQLLSIPNVASDTPNIRKNADYIVAQMQKLRLKPRLLEAGDSKVPPVVYGEWNTPGATKTIILYAHYDGQPTDPKQWTGIEPWKPVLFSAPMEKGGTKIAFPAAGEKIDPEWRLYARSASDDKAGVFAILKAFEALKAKNIQPTVNIKFLFEGEEEAGSPHLREIISANKELLKADAFIVCDGPVHQSGRKEVVFGVRGVTSVDITVYGANRSLHSGHYGNWSPNPALTLAKLLSSMKDDRGNITVKGWADDVEPLGPVEKKAIADAPKFDAELKRQLGISYTEGGGRELLGLINLPSLNIDGFKSGDVGALARNVIPSTANAVLDLRLVKGNDYVRQVEKLRKHIESQGFYVIDHDPTTEERLNHPFIAKFIHLKGGYNAQRTRMDLPISLRVIDAVQAAASEPVVRMPTLGGSLPLSIISETLNIPTITIPIANYDNNQHAENENIRIQNLWDGIETFASLMTMKFRL